MNKRIRDKINEIEKYLEEICEIIPDGLKKYKEDFKTKAACERYAERIIEALTDLAFLVIKENGFSSPESDSQAFEILSENRIISSELAEKMQNAKSMRNILAHEYGEIDDEIVFHAIAEELGTDVQELINSVKNKLNKRNKE